HRPTPRNCLGGRDSCGTCTDTRVPRYARSWSPTRSGHSAVDQTAPAWRACDRFAAMTELGPAAWPPAPIRTDRLVLRESEARGRAAFIELFASPKVGTYVGGSRPRDELERAVPEVPGRRPGFFVIDLDGAMIGVVTLDRRDEERKGRVRPDGGETELGYMFL